MSRGPSPAAAGDPGVVGRRTQGLAHHDLQRLQPARPAVGRPSRAGARDRQAAGLRRSRSGGAVAAHPQGRRRRPGDHRTAQLFVQRSRRARTSSPGLAESCEEVGQGLLLVAVGPSRTVDDGPAAVLAAGVDGFVVYAAVRRRPLPARGGAAALPVVVVDQPKDVPGASRVGIDDRAAMRAMAEYVVGLGHREIGLLTMRLGREWPHGGRRPAVADPERVRNTALPRPARTHQRCARRDGRRGAEPDR